MGIRVGIVGVKLRVLSGLGVRRGTLTAMFRSVCAQGRTRCLKLVR